MREKEYSEWMSKQGFDVLRHANCCKIAFNGGWESRQTEVDELHKISVALNAETIRQREQVAYYLSKNAELQKRVDKAIRLLVEAGLYQSEPNIDLALQVLKGGEA